MWICLFVSIHFKRDYHMSCRKFYIRYRGNSCSGQPRHFAPHLPLRSHFTFCLSPDHSDYMLSSGVPATPRPRPPAKLRRASAAQQQMQASPPPPYAAASPIPASKECPSTSNKTAGKKRHSLTSSMDGVMEEWMNERS